MNFWLLGLIVAIVLASLVCLPFAAYMCIKLGTYAWFRGRQLFKQENKDGEEKT